ncbi:cell adhesion molecule 3 isoform X7 [Anomaloglossus baeobatrachus]|uniref:cell adhesion molecule 3 isoform X7 n=1 Tax=Anomaloglossus baeobatrachus TaxID=238106 RepID=UPI003F50C733
MTVMYLAAILLLTLAGFTGANVSEYDHNLEKPLHKMLSIDITPEASQPVTSDVLVATGGRMTLTCTVDDHEDSSLQWSNPAQQTLYFGEKRALRDNRIQLVKSTKNELSISISNVALSDEGEYTCSIFTMPVRTAKAMVTVLGVPQEPQIAGYDRPIRENQNAELRCTTSGSKPAANIRWYKGPEELEGARNSETKDSNGKTFTVVSLISFPVTKADDQVEITCTVGHESMPNTFKSSSQKLQVLYHPTAKIESRPSLPREGDRLQLQCDAYGNPEPLKYTWLRKNGELPTTAVTDHNSLVFQNLNKSDSGTYMCQVFNLLGDYIAEYNLDVNGTYLTHEAKGSDDAPDADTAIINAEGGQGGSDDKKEYFI